MNRPDPPALNPWTVAWQTGFRAIMRNRLPAIVLWVFGAGIVAGYYTVPAVEDLLNAIGQLKQRAGWIFSAISTSIFGGLLPVLIPWLLGRREIAAGSTPLQISAAYLLSNCIFWALKGIEIDLFYRFQAKIFGDDNDWATISWKTLVDQLLYVPTIGLGNVILFYQWRNGGYSWQTTRRDINRTWYQRRMLPTLIANWAVWLPAVVLIYCLPLALQLPIQNLILCFWVIILVFFTSPRTADDTGPDSETIR